jgi:hypothetical protein
MAIFSSTTNFVSGEVTTECFGSSAPTYYCVSTVTYPGGHVDTWVTECSTDKDGNINCHALDPKPKPPGIDQAIQNEINEVGPSNPNNSKDLGGTQADKGITKSPIE